MRGLAGREGQNSPAALCVLEGWGREERGNEDSSLSCRLFHSHTHSKSLVSVCPSCRPEGTEATARITIPPTIQSMASKRGGQCQGGAMLLALRQKTTRSTNNTQ